jgi:hypothetical protein
MKFSERNTKAAGVGNFTADDARALTKAAVRSESIDAVYAETIEAIRLRAADGSSQVPLPPSYEQLRNAEQDMVVQQIESAGFTVHRDGRVVAWA